MPLRDCHYLQQLVTSNILPNEQGIYANDLFYSDKTLSNTKKWSQVGSKTTLELQHRGAYSTCMVALLERKGGLRRAKQKPEGIVAYKL